jgi:hypothetical protein
LSRPVVNIANTSDNELQPQQQQPHQCKMLFVVAEDDPINPTEGAIHNRDEFESVFTWKAEDVNEMSASSRTPSVTTIFHPKGNYIPVQDPTAIKCIVHWVADNSL